MQRLLRQFGGAGVWVCLVCWAAAFAGASEADKARHAGAVGYDQLWRRTIDFASHGDFQRASDTIQQIHEGGALLDTVRAWLEEYEAQQVMRRQMNQADFEKYVGYAKARIERKEYHKALNWSLWAFDCADDRDKFLRSDWLQDLVNEALVAAEALRGDQDWRGAWHVYSQLSALFEREPRYQKLEREVLTHLRLDAMFKEGSHWDERIENVRWSDAKAALERIKRFYVVDVDFRELAESGLEQMLFLAESKTAPEQFEGLGNEDDRNDFVARVRKRLELVRTAPAVDHKGCIRIFERVVKEINKETVRLPEALVVSELMRGALDPLDDFTTIIWPTDSAEFDKHTRGNFVGVGISIRKNAADEIEVVTPLEDTPAYRAGIQAGDVIIKVDGKSIENYSLNKVVETITGPKGTRVVLTIRRDGTEIPFPLQRARVKIRSVKGIRRDPLFEERWDHWLDRERGIAYIRVTNFQRNTVEDVDNVLSELTAVGLKGLILDLRSNPGGLLDAAWQLTARFLKRGDPVVSTRGRHKSDDQTFDTNSEGPYSDIALVVLVDERSASASEIVSGAVRDNRRGTVIGQRTFGKFSVQNLIPLSRSGAKLKITTARYYLPSGASFHHEPDSDEWGVQPDIPIRVVRKEVSKLYQVWREANLLGPPKPSTSKTDADENDDDSTDGDASTGNDGSTDDNAGKNSVKPDRKDTGEGDEKEGSTDGTDEAEGSKEPKLPPLKQPDENDRPKADPQLDAALLLLRLTLVGDLCPTLATAETDPSQPSAKP